MRLLVAVTEGAMEGAIDSAYIWIFTSFAYNFLRKITKDSNIWYVGHSRWTMSRLKYLMWIQSTCSQKRLNDIMVLGSLWTNRSGAYLGIYLCGCLQILHTRRVGGPVVPFGVDELLLRFQYYDLFRLFNTICSRSILYIHDFWCPLLCLFRFFYFKIDPPLWPRS